MTSEQQTTPEPAQLPMAPSQIRAAALDELERLPGFVQRLSLDDWKKPSAASGWTIGDVVAHLNLTFGLYRRLLDAVSAGRGAGTMWKTFGRITKTVVPAASPAVNAVNSAIPRLIDRALSPEIIQAQFATGSRSLREQLTKIESADYTRPVYYQGGPWPLSFFLAAVVNELAIHGWDMASPLDPQAHLSEGARAVLPWFYWGGTPFLLSMPNQVTGRLQVTTTDPATEMWWDVTSTGTNQGVGRMENPDVTITGEGGTFVLALAGRISADDAFRTTSLNADGKESLAQIFLGAWKIL